MLKIHPRTKRFIKYAFIGGSTFLFDLIILYFLTEFFHLFYLLSASLAFLIATSVNYVINRKWNFTNSKRKNIVSYPIFISINVMTLFMIVVLMALAVENLGYDYLISRIIIGIGIGLVNFALNSKISFQTPIFKDK